MSTYERLIAVIRAFVEAESWDESREIVERHPESLTTDVGAALETFARNAEEAGDADMAQTFRNHRALLRRCAEVGTVAAFLELDAPAGGPPQRPGLEIPREVLTLLLGPLPVECRGSRMQRRSRRGDDVPLRGESRPHRVDQRCGDYDAISAGCATPFDDWVGRLSRVMEPSER